jgi:Ser/Thr protein kinase RdoA (MazF antagonist)
MTGRSARGDDVHAWVPSSTHHVELGETRVVKRFRSWSRGEHLREWRALRLLAEHAPGLAPTPLRADLDDTPPVVTMSRLAGEPVGGGPASVDEIAAMARAIEALHRAVPHQVLVALPLRTWHAAEAADEVRRWSALPLERAAARGLDPVLLAAHGAGVRWLAFPDLDAAVRAEAVPVFGHADGNVGNHLWDGSTMRLVDFEDSGRSDRALELADLVEHLSNWQWDHGDQPALLSQVDLSRAEATRVGTFRRLLAMYWLLMLMPDGPAVRRNPAGTDLRQARRLLAMLG